MASFSFIPVEPGNKLNTSMSRVPRADAVGTSTTSTANAQTSDLTPGDAPPNRRRGRPPRSSQATVPPSQSTTLTNTQDAHLPESYSLNVAMSLDQSSFQQQPPKSRQQTTKSKRPPPKSKANASSSAQSGSMPPPPVGKRPRDAENLLDPRPTKLAKATTGSGVDRGNMTQPNRSLPVVESIPSISRISRTGRPGSQILTGQIVGPSPLPMFSHQAHGAAIPQQLSYSIDAGAFQAQAPPSQVSAHAHLYNATNGGTLPCTQPLVPIQNMSYSSGMGSQAQVHGLGFLSVPSTSQQARHQPGQFPDPGRMHHQQFQVANQSSIPNQNVAAIPGSQSAEVQRTVQLIQLPNGYQNIGQVQHTPQSIQFQGGYHQSEPVLDFGRQFQKGLQQCDPVAGFGQVQRTAQPIQSQRGYQQSEVVLGQPQIHQRPMIPGQKILNIVPNMPQGIRQGQVSNQASHYGPNGPQGWSTASGQTQSQHQYQAAQTQNRDPTQPNQNYQTRHASIPSPYTISQPGEPQYHAALDPATPSLYPQVAPGILTSAPPDTDHANVPAQPQGLQHNQVQLNIQNQFITTVTHGTDGGVASVPPVLGDADVPASQHRGPQQTGVAVNINNQRLNIVPQNAPASFASAPPNHYASAPRPQAQGPPQKVKHEPGHMVAPPQAIPRMTQSVNMRHPGYAAKPLQTALNAQAGQHATNQGYANAATAIQGSQQRLFEPTFAPHPSQQTALDGPLARPNSGFEGTQSVAGSGHLHQQIRMDGRFNAIQQASGCGQSNGPAQNISLPQHYRNNSTPHSYSVLRRVGGGSIGTTPTSEYGSSDVNPSHWSTPSTAASSVGSQAFFTQDYFRPQHPAYGAQYPFQQAVGIHQDSTAYYNASGSSHALASCETLVYQAQNGTPFGQHNIPVHHQQAANLPQADESQDENCFQLNDEQMRQLDAITGHQKAAIAQIAQGEPSTSHLNEAIPSSDNDGQDNVAVKRTEDVVPNTQSETTAVLSTPKAPTPLADDAPSPNVEEALSAYEALMKQADSLGAELDLTEGVLESPDELFARFMNIPDDAE